MQKRKGYITKKKRKKKDLRQAHKIQNQTKTKRGKLNKTKKKKKSSIPTKKKTNYKKKIKQKKL